MLIHKDLNLQTCSDIVTLFNIEVGQDYNYEDALKWYNDPNIIVATIGSPIIGAATAHILSKDETEEYIEYMDDPRCWWNYAMLDDSAVKPEFRGLGFGKELLAMRLKWLKERNCRKVFALAWEHPGDRKSAPLLKGNGFNVLKTIPEMWKEVGCPYCGEECTCDALLMSKEL